MNFEKQVLPILRIIKEKYLDALTPKEQAAFNDLYQCALDISEIQQKRRSGRGGEEPTAEVVV